jgi:hypothetical protein
MLPENHTTSARQIEQEYDQTFASCGGLYRGASIYSATIQQHYINQEQAGLFCETMCELAQKRLNHIASDMPTC